MKPPEYDTINTEEIAPPHLFSCLFYKSIVAMKTMKTDKTLNFMIKDIGFHTYSKSTVNQMI